MKKSNMKIREALFSNGIPQWRLAELMGISEFTLSRRLRKELSKGEQDKILHLIRKEVEVNERRKIRTYNGNDA